VEEIDEIFPADLMSPQLFLGAFAAAVSCSDVTGASEW